jgi:hypothetical protein
MFRPRQSKFYSFTLKYSLRGTTFLYLNLIAVLDLIARERIDLIDAYFITDGVLSANSFSSGERNEVISNDVVWRLGLG